MRESGIWFTPTLVTYDQIVQQADDLDAFLSRPEMKYIPPSLLYKLKPENNGYKRGISSWQVPKFKQSLAFQKRLVRALHEAGVPMLAGTDSMGIGTTAGFSLHEELCNFTESGLTPFEALQTATSRAAEFLKGTAEFGTVTVGKRADLILVEGNPLKDVANASRLKGVMVRGRWLSESELAQMLHELPVVYAREEQFVRMSLERDAQEAVHYLDENDPSGRLASYILLGISLEQGAAHLRKIIGEVKRSYPEATLVKERTLNALGYQLLRIKKLKEAIDIFKLNVETYPKSANTYDSLAEAYMAVGNRELAIEYYKKAPEVDPKYPNAQYVLEFLKKFNPAN